VVIELPIFRHNYLSSWEDLMVNNAVEAETRPITKSEERWAFLILAVFLAPFMAGVIVGGYGFIVWMLQVVFGPPSG